MTSPAHPDDILVVCWSEERRLFPQFEPRQVVVADTPAKIQGRKFRTAWVTGPARNSTNTRFWQALEAEAYFRDADIQPAENYQENA